MPDNIVALANTGTGTDVLATDEIAGVHFPRAKIGFGADGSYNDISAANPLPVSVASLPLPTGGATEATLAALNGKVPPAGQALMAASQPVVIASNQSPIPTAEQVLVLTGAAAQTAVVNNILESVSGTAGTASDSFRAVSVQVVSTGTAGTFIFEQSNDNVNWAALPVFNAALVTGVPIVGAITATVSQIIYTFPVRCRFIRLRIATLITGGSIQAFSRFSTDPYAPAVTTVAQPTAASLNATVAGAVTATVAAATLAAPTIIADVASAALTTTTTTAAFTPTAGSSYVVVVPVTAVTGTTPTLDIGIEESDDTGTNWFRVYDFPRITATGIFRSPKLPLTGNRIRYVQTVTGTTPSFTRAINRLQSIEGVDGIRQLIDRSLATTQTLNAVTPSLNVQNCRNAQLLITAGAITTAPALQLEGTDDNGVTWYAIGAPLTAVASSTVRAVTVDVNSQLIRARVSTAGAAATLTHVLLKGY